MIKNKNISDLKPIPMWYIISVIILVIYGIFSVSVLGTLHGNLLYIMNMINLSITFFWMFYNMFMIYYFINNNYAIEGVIFAIYYVTLNVLNAFNMKYSWINSYEVLRNISIATKVLEVLVISWFFLGLKFAKE